MVCKKDINSFFQIYGSKPVIVKLPLSRFSDDISDKWPGPSKDDGQTVVMDNVEGVKDVASEAKEGEKIIYITGEEPRDIIRV